MKTFPVGLKNNPKRQSGNVVTVTDSLVDPNSGIYMDVYFNDILCLERKRSERSKKSFLLMLLNIGKVAVSGDRIKLVNQIVKILSKCTRETDIKGWYDYNNVIGVLFTEIGETCELVCKDTIFNKLHKSLCECLDKALVDNIEVYFLVYPEKNHKQPPNDSPSEHLYPDLMRKSSPMNISSIAKRTMDIVGSLGCLLIFAPFFIVFSFLIKLSSEGPVFFRQERIGQFGKKFKCLKFRSMYVNNDHTIHKEFVENLIAGTPDVSQNTCGADSAAPYKIQNDPRVTSIGRVLRKTSLDELPQFLNVLLGDMSLVGPRPPIAYEVECYDIWHKRRVLEVKPGITGLWQVSGRSSTTFDDMVRLDLKYVREWSVWLDIKLLVKTPWVVLTGKGGY
jgi:lipopolysaccharide/colanic/teichoic acid biosynthesis glycosyltransferase